MAELRIQDPLSLTSITLHESIIEACQEAIRGGGAFAFVTKEGAELLLLNPTFSEMCVTGSFNLVAGVDEITNTRAIEALERISAELPGLNVKVFLHEYSDTTFHPKFCWFRHERGGVLITGSGNLTLRGLRSNWEAFTVTQLTNIEVDQIETIWNQWNESNSEVLKDLDDEEVIECAADNTIEASRRSRAERTGRERRRRSRRRLPRTQTPILHDILVAEIPRASNRWNQANFDQNNFENFFGMTIGIPNIIATLQHVSDDGSLGEIESRPGVSVRSQNYRIELSAAHGLDYPRTGRPIGIFVRIATRTFQYRLLMPDDPHYRTVADFLNANWHGRQDRMKRIVLDSDTLRTAWPDSPLWLISDSEQIS